MTIPRRIDEIVPGYYRYRCVRGGPYMPAEVTLEDGMVYVVEADRTLKVGIDARVYDDLVIGHVMDGTAFDSPLVRVLWFGEPIDEAEYRHMLAMLIWAQEHHPDHPMLHPDKPIRLADVAVKMLF